MKKKVYQELASRINAMENCQKSGNWEWRAKHNSTIFEIMESSYLPSGSGIDAGCVIDTNRHDILIINSSYHTMDENGYYGKWIEFTVKVRPSLQDDFDLNITGKFGKDQDLKDYLYDVFSDALSSEIEFNAEGELVQS